MSQRMSTGHCHTAVTTNGDVIPTTVIADDDIPTTVIADDDLMAVMIADDVMAAIEAAGLTEYVDQRPQRTPKPVTRYGF